jgi:hypothetical protein
VLRAGTVSTNVYLGRLQNHCLDLGWLPVHVLPKKKFPKIKHKEQRAITAEEHVPLLLTHCIQLQPQTYAKTNKKNK